MGSALFHDVTPSGAEVSGASVVASDCDVLVVPVHQVEPALEVPKKIAACDASGWITLLPELELSGVAKTLAFHCVVKKSEENVLWVILDQAYDTLYNEMNQQRIEKALRKHYSADIILHVESGVVEVETPAMQYERWKQERLQEAHQSIYSDPNVRSLMASYGVIVDDNSIAPKNN